MKIRQILQGAAHRLDIFSGELLGALEKALTEKDGRLYAECVVRKKQIRMTPEEVVRQLYVMKLMEEYRYPHSRLRIEHSVAFGSETKRADIVIMDERRPDVPYIMVEVKSPKMRDGKEQLKSYCSATGAPMAVWTNGWQIEHYHRKDPNYFEEIRGIPQAGQSLRDILQENWTLDDLIENDKLVREGISLKNVIENLEDEVLANAGVNVFEEVFKLIYAKLYDEWHAGSHADTRKENLCFHNAGGSDAELKEKITTLFEDAKEKWPGVFAGDSGIALSPSHLAVCIGSLESVKLLNSNLDVVDDAFEFLISKTAKGDKGQYFTPRYVIDMCVKMLDPDEKENMIDTASGSSGFPIHTVFHVWKKILARKGKKQSHLFTLERKPPECGEYVAKRVFALDFDETAVRVSRALNLIAGDGQTNVLHLNTLDYDNWKETANDENWRDIYGYGEKGLRKLRAQKSSTRDHLFDIVMANPPFAGDIRESAIIRRYELGKKKAARANINKPTREKGWQDKISRHILFIERNLQFLKPGGRMAIVLPQGIFNNATNDTERRFIAEHCRILAVVGLHGNTFKPHTGTKTSVLFVQKWNDDKKAGPLCPRKDDYNIFFGTMQKSGKDNSGDKIFLRNPQADNGEPELLLDENKHLITDHDLFNLWSHHFADGNGKAEVKRRLDSPGIAEAFLEFAKKEGLSFAKKP
ncbi:MAG: N-6 DNA methylase [Gammaproteobacteria bacterium]